MSEGTISVPTWALPVVAAVLSIAVAWGAANARAEATEAEVDRIERVVTEAAQKIGENGELTKVNQAKIEAIVSSLSDQAETAKESDAKLQQLIEIMLKAN